MDPHYWEKPCPTLCSTNWNTASVRVDIIRWRVLPLSWTEVFMALFGFLLARKYTRDQGCAPAAGAPALPPPAGCKEEEPPSLQVCRKHMVRRNSPRAGELWKKMFVFLER